MKSFRNIAQVIAATLFAISLITSAWGELHSISYGDNNTVYYASGATEEEGQLLVQYLEDMGLSNSDIYLERQGEQHYLRLKLLFDDANIGSSSLPAELKVLAKELEADVFHERTAIAAANQDGRIAFEMNKPSDIDDTLLEQAIAQQRENL